MEHLSRLRRLVGRTAPRGAEESERAWKVSAEEVKARGYNLDIKNPHTVAEDHGDPETLLEDLDRRRGRAGGAPRPVKGDPVRGAGAMNAERLLAHYEQVAEAPDAIPRLRRFMLDLAVRGKLVPAGGGRRTGVGAAEAHRGGKARPVKAGRSEARDLAIGDELVPPFDIPAPWRWCRLILGAISGAGLLRQEPTEYCGGGDGFPR